MSKKTALLVIDVQMAMFESEVDGAVYQADEVLERICLLIEKARSSNVPVVFVQHTENEGEYGRGKPTWQLNPRLGRRETDPVVEKSFWDSFYETRLQDELQKLGVEKLVIVGMQTEFCLDTTCRRAFSLGYENVLVGDAHSTFDGPVLKAPQIIAHHNQIWGGRFVRLLPACEVEF